MWGKVYPRWYRVFSIAVVLAVIMLGCSYILCISFDIASGLAIYIALVVGVGTFFLSLSIVDKYFPHYRIAKIYDDPAPVSRIVDEDGNEVELPQAPEIAREEARLPVDPGFLEVMGVVEKEFNPRIIRDEKELEDLLYALLSGKYPGAVRRDICGPEGKIDLVLDDRFGIELRAIDSEKPLRSLIGDVAFYTDRYEQMAVVLFIDRLLALKLDLEQYTEKLDNYGAIVIIKQGMIEGKKIV